MQMNRTHSKLVRFAKNPQSRFVQLVFLYVLLDVVKMLRPCGKLVGQVWEGNQGIRQTSKAEIPQGAFVPFKMVVDPEALVVFF